MRMRVKVVVAVILIFAALVPFCRFGEIEQGPLRLRGTLLPTFLISHTVKVTVTNISDQPVALGRCNTVTHTLAVGSFIRRLYGPCEGGPKVTLQPGESLSEVHGGKPQWLWMEQEPSVSVDYYPGGPEPVFVNVPLRTWGWWPW